MQEQHQAETVRFSRFIIMILITSYALFGFVVGMYLVLAITLSTLLFTSRLSLTSFMLRLLKIVKFDKVFKLNHRYERSFFINREVEVFEESLRLMVGIAVLMLDYYGLYTASVSLAFFMATMMLISTFFGFCISGLLFIAYKVILKKFDHA